MVAALGRKGRMTQVYREDGVAVPATEIRLGGCVVVARRSKDKHGYEAVQLGVGEIPAKQVRKPQAGYFKKAGVAPVRVLREVRMADASAYAPGQAMRAELFRLGDVVRVEGRTKGRGFAGGMKRWGWHGGPMTHGGMSKRRIGSVGSGTSPGRVHRGRTLPGHYGVERVTVRNLRVVKIEPERNVVYVSGAVPGHRDAVVLLRKDS